MSHVKNLQTNRKQQKNKAANNVFKYVLFGITLFVVFLIIASFATIILSGVGTVNNNDSYTWTQILFGERFDMHGYMAMGIIVINTIWMSILVLLVATPISVATALFITKLANKGMRNFMIAVVSILAAIPSVIYGSFGKFVILDLVNKFGFSELSTSSTLISVVIIVSLMVIPTITLMSTTSLMMVDRKMEDSSEALGATKVQTSIFVSLRSAKTGIIIGMLFALGRCLGEATAISMLSGETPDQIGVTFRLSEVSLFMSPTIIYAFGQAQQGIDTAIFAYSVLSALLLITIILLFAFVKFIEHKTDDVQNSKRQSAKAVELHNIKKMIEKNQYDLLKESEIKKYHANLNRINAEQARITSTAYLRANEIAEIQGRSSRDNSMTAASYKESRSMIYKGVIIGLSMIGVLALISILGFLFKTDLSLLFNWEYLSSPGTIWSEWSNGQYIGLGVCMFGTMFNIFMTLLIALPLGILIATYTHTYLQGEGIINRVVSFAFQIMTSIPAVVYGTLAAIIFSYSGFFRQNYNSMVPVFMLVLVVLPTIIKQTQEGFNNVKNSQIEGSHALGATDSYTSFRIVIKQAMPAILSAAILAISIVMADSAISITIIGKPGELTYASDWIKKGGYTLATNIYYLSFADTLTIPRYIAIEQIKVIGIILMLLIFWLSMISQKIKSQNNMSASIMAAGILFYMCSYWIFGGVMAFMFIGLLLGLIGLFYDLIIRIVKGK